MGKSTHPCPVTQCKCSPVPGSYQTCSTFIFQLWQSLVWGHPKGHKHLKVCSLGLREGKVHPPVLCTPCWWLGGKSYLSNLLFFPFVVLSLRPGTNAQVLPFFFLNFCDSVLDVYKQITTSPLNHPLYTQTFSLSANRIVVYLSYKVLLLPIYLIFLHSFILWNASFIALPIIAIQIKF